MNFNFLLIIDSLFTVAICAWAQIPLGISSYVQREESIPLSEPLSNIPHDKYETSIVDGYKRSIRLIGNTEKSALLWRESSEVHYQIKKGSLVIVRQGELLSPSSIRSQESPQEEINIFSMLDKLSNCFQGKCNFEASIPLVERRQRVESNLPHNSPSPKTIKIYKELSGSVTLLEGDIMLILFEWSDLIINEATVDDLRVCVQSIESFEELERSLRADCLARFPLIIFAIWLS